VAHGRSIEECIDDLEWDDGEILVVDPPVWRRKTSCSSAVRLIRSCARCPFPCWLSRVTTTVWPRCPRTNPRQSRANGRLNPAQAWPAISRLGVRF
jgi:hypothetical protein